MKYFPKERGLYCKYANCINSLVNYFEEIRDDKLTR